MQTERVIVHIVKWLKDYLQTSRTKGFVLGVSGGIDSAVTSTLCARTGAPVLVLDMPIKQSSNETQRSHTHIKWLKENFPNEYHLIVSFALILSSNSFNKLLITLVLPVPVVPVANIEYFESKCVYVYHNVLTLVL